MTKHPVQARRLAPATFIGIQDGFGVFPSIELYNLTARVGIHSVGSSVSDSTTQRLAQLSSSRTLYGQS